jgi:hypothetical protein
LETDYLRNSEKSCCCSLRTSRWQWSSWLDHNVPRCKLPFLSLPFKEQTKISRDAPTIWPGFFFSRWKGSVASFCPTPPLGKLLYHFFLMLLFESDLVMNLCGNDF